MGANSVACVQLGILRKEKDRAQWVRVYTGAITLLGMTIIVAALINFAGDLRGLILFSAMAAVAELFSVELFTSSRSRVSVSSVVAIAGILVFGPLAGALVHMVSGIMTVVTTTLRSEQPESTRVSPLRRSTFNTGMWVTAAAIAGWVYVLAGGTPGTVSQPSNVLPLLVAGTADTLANLMILIGVIALQTGRRPLHIWKQDFQWAAPVAIAVGALGGGVLALAYEMFQILGLAVFFLPILSITYSLRLYVANMKVYVDKLEQANLVLEEANLGLLETLGAVIDAYDVYTYGHSTQVAVYAAAIAEKMDLLPEGELVVVRAALVHDIGKVGIMDSITSKLGLLTDEEYNLMKRHPIIGAEIVGQMRGLQELVPLVRHHHERWDGGGYPDGLKGEKIPLGARILTLADSLDAMFSDRPYRRTRGFKEVMEEIVECSWAQFDPNVVKAFFAVAEEKGKDFFKNSAATVDRTVRVGRVANFTEGVTFFLKKSMVADLTS